MINLHTSFSRDGRVLVYDGERQIGHARKRKIGAHHLWQIVLADGTPIGQNALLNVALENAALVLRERDLP